MRLKTEALGGAIFLVVGLASTGAAAWMAKDSVPLAIAGVPAEGKVTLVHHGKLVVVEYRVGTTPFALEHRSWSKRTFVQGQFARVLYLPGDQGKAKVADSLTELLFLPGLLALVGITFVVGGFFTIRNHLLLVR